MSKKEINKKLAVCNNCIISRKETAQAIFKELEEDMIPYRLIKEKWLK